MNAVIKTSHLAYDAFSAAGITQDLDWARKIILPFKLFDYQTYALHLSFKYSRFGLFLDCGLGKTIVMQLNAIYQAHYGIRVLVTMPPSLFDQFEESYAEIKGNTPELFMFNDPLKIRKQYIEHFNKQNKWPPILAMSLNIFRKYWRLFRKVGYSSLIADESHIALANDSSKTYEYVTELLKGDTRLILSSATPVPGGAENAYGPIKLINPEAYEDRLLYDRIHLIKKRLPGTRNFLVVGYRDLNIVNESLMKQAIRLKYSDVVGSKPPNIQSISVTLSPEHRKLYRTLMKEKIIERKEELITALNIQKLYQLAQQLTSNPNNFSDTKISNYLYDELNNLLISLKADSEEKVIIFGNYRITLENLKEHFKKYIPAIIYGGSDSNKELKKFKTDCSCRIALINYKSGGAGLSLEKQSASIVLFEPPASPTTFEQACSRVIRHGQLKDIRIFLLAARGTYMQKNVDNLIDRKDFYKQMMGDVNNLLDNLLPEQ
jgi:SNF2 family DNA or RNA helicase